MGNIIYLFFYSFNIKMGGHGTAIHGNPNNIKEEDADMSSRIRSIELIKHNPQLFHLDFWNPNNHFNILGGVKTLGASVLGGFIALQYFKGGMATRPYNFYVNIHQGLMRFVFGMGIGGGCGYIKFGDR